MHRYIFAQLVEFEFVKNSLGQWVVKQPGVVYWPFAEAGHGLDIILGHELTVDYGPLEAPEKGYWPKNPNSFF